MSSREFAIIERYFKSLSQSGEGVVLGPGDDCAVLRVPEGEELCVSTDTLVEGVHFLPGSDPNVIVARVMAANLSDLAAMGAKPFAFLLAATLPEEDERWLESFSLALSSRIGEYGVPLVGGNLSRGSLSFTMTVMGTVQAGTAVTRRGAKAGDLIFVSGHLGDAACGLGLCRSGATSGYLAERYCYPTPRLAAGERLRELATSMIDISDGLLAEVGHLVATDNLGAEIRTETLPLSAELVASVGLEEAVKLALSGGDDYELCFTLQPTDLDKAMEISRELDLPLTKIGTITDSGQVSALDADGRSLSTDRTGYQHF